MVVTLLVLVTGCSRERFTSGGDGVTRDRKTGLEWTSRDHERALAWDDADRHCRELVRGDAHGTWRLPELAEVEQVYDPLVDEPCGERRCHLTPTIRLGGPYVWTATSRGPATRFYFDFGWGTSFSPGKPPTLVRRTLCVRGAAPSASAAPTPDPDEARSMAREGAFTLRARQPTPASARQLARRHRAAAADVLPRPEWREIAPARGLGLRAQRRERERGEGERGRYVAQRSELAHQAIDDAARRPAAEQIGERGVVRSVGRATRRDGSPTSWPRDRADTRSPPGRPPRRARARPRRRRASAMPPAAITGTRTARTTCGSSANVPACRVRSSERKWPRCPPASSPCATIASTPRASSPAPRRPVVADERIRAPVARTRASRSLGGRPKWKLTTAGRSSSSRCAASAPNGVRAGPGGMRAGSMPYSA